MSPLRCPGQDMRNWTPKDIFDVACPYCGEEIEFWKDEPTRICPGCGVGVRNPRIDLGCAKWCQFAAECLGKNVEELAAAAPIVERIKAELEKALADRPDRLAFAELVHEFADMLAAAEREADPRVIKCAALLIGAEGADREKEDAPCPALPTDLPEQIGLDNIASAHVRMVLELARGTAETGGIETRIVHDALVLARARQQSPPPDIQALVAELTLDKAAILARHRFQEDHAH